ncbi:unnamed protein product [Calypogeia fissa]
MAPKRKKETKESKNLEQKGKADKSKDLVNEESVPPNPDVPKPWVNPLPLVTGKEVFAPLAKGEHQFISILNAEVTNPSIFTRSQKIEIFLDDPYKPPVVVKHYDGSSCDCYFKHELTHQHDLCEKCEEIWRRWNWKWTPLPPVEIDPYENFLCVGDIDPHFQPVRGDIVIFHPVGPQGMLGLKAEWGFVSSYIGERGLELNQHDLVIRLGSFSNSQNVVDHIPYDKVEVRAMTQDKQWRFLGGQAALIHKEPFKPPPPVQPIAPLEMKDGKKDKKGKKDKPEKKDKKDKKKDSKKDESQAAEGTEKASKKKKGDKEKKTDKKNGKDKTSDGQSIEIQIATLPEFTLDGIPNFFNIIQKGPDPIIPHPGEAVFRPYCPSLTCNYKYNKPGMQCGMGEFLPQFGDIVIQEPQAWMHDEWGDKKKRSKGSMVKWYKPTPWKRELKQGMLLLRPYIDRYTQFYDEIPQCEYTPLMWSQWGVAELYLFDGRVAPKVEPIKIDGEAPPEPVNPAGQQDEKDQKSDKKAKKQEKKVNNGDKKDDAKSKKKEKQEGNKQEKKSKDNAKPSKGNKISKTNVDEENQKDLEDNTGEKTEEPQDDMLWKYWGRSIHNFDEPYQFWALDKFCRSRHLRDVQKLPHLDFFVEDTGVESDLEHAPKVVVDEVPPPKPEGKKGKKEKGKSDKSKDKKEKQKDGEKTKKKKKT